MDIKQAVSTIMSTDLKTVGPQDPVLKVGEIMNEYNIHHVPVVDEDSATVGIVSSSDLLYFLRAIHPDSNEQYINDMRLKNYKVEEMMTKSISVLAPDDTIEMALRLFAENMFHGLPVVADEKLVGILTTQDIIVNLLKQG